MKTVVLNARVRTQRGTRACRKLRRSGEIPANLYGKGEAVSLAVNAYAMMKLIDENRSLLEVAFEGRKELVQVTEVQRDTFGDDVLHVDLHKIRADKPIHSEVGLVFKGDAKGVKMGGHLVAILKVLSLESLPHLMPREILVRVDDLDINDAIHIEDIQLPEGVTALGEARQLVVHVVPPVAETDEDEGGPPMEAGPSEPEVIGKGKQDDES